MIFFNKIDSQEKAYILGFFTADAHINKDKYFIQLVLHEKDRHIIEDMLRVMESNHLIKTEKRNITDHNYSKIYIHSKNLSKKLDDLGLKRNKTFIHRFPNLDDNLIPHFIRGIGDGDAAIKIHGGNGSNKDTARYSLISNRIFCEQLQKYLRDKVGINSCIYKHVKADERLAYIEIGGNRQLLRFLDYIYKDATIYLKRKHDRYLVVKELVAKADRKKPSIICDILNCGRKSLWQGLCNSHYYQHRVHKLTRIIFPI